jgi:hypothetical protein
MEAFAVRMFVAFVIGVAALCIFSLIVDRSDNE